MDYLGIIKRSYHISIKNKFLWIFGILAGGAAGFKGLNLNSVNYSTGSADWNKFSSSLNSYDWASFWDKFALTILGVMLFILIFAVVMFVLNIISQGALVGSVDKLDKNEKANFKIGFGIGWHQFWRIWGMALTYLAMILASLVVMVAPVVVAIVFSNYIFAVIWGCLLLLVCLIFWILIGLISPYSLRVIVLEKYGIWQSIRESLHLFRDHWIEVILIYLLLIAISLGFAIAVGLGLLLIGGLLLLVGYGAWLASSLAAVIYGVVAGLGFFILIVIVSGAFNAFYSAAITLTYQKLTRKS